MGNAQFASKRGSKDGLSPMLSHFHFLSVNLIKILLSTFDDLGGIGGM